MRITATGNLTVELIRAERFDVAHRIDSQAEAHLQSKGCPPKRDDGCRPPVDRVELSPQAIACDPWATPVDRAAWPDLPAIPTEEDAEALKQADEPRRLSPVLGSPALAGLGVALVVPGSLLDVVA